MSAKQLKTEVHGKNEWGLAQCFLEENRNGVLQIYLVASDDDGAMDMNLSVQQARKLAAGLIACAERLEKKS